MNTHKHAAGHKGHGNSKVHCDHDAHEGRKDHDHQSHHAHTAADFLNRFWILLILTLPILALSPMLQKWVGLRQAIRFSGDTYVLFAFSSAVFWYGGWPFLKGLFNEVRTRKSGMMISMLSSHATSHPKSPMRNQFSVSENKMDCSMNIQPSRATITLLGMCIAVLMLGLGGCATWQSNATEETSRRLDGAAAGERVTTAELNELTRAFADRYVGLLYSVCDSLKEDNPDPAQRRAAQILLVDNANNVYDIASNADAFTRVLDLVVVTTLVSQEWDDDGRAVAVFGKRGQKLADALSQASAESQMLAARVLTADQLGILDSLLQDWRQENPKVVRASFIRFSNFAIGRGRSAASQVLEARGLFVEVGEAGEAVDEARLLAERTFYRLKRESTLLRWQAAAVKDDWVATPELITALADLHSVTDQIEQLPANIAAERQAILTGIDDRLQRADATIANVQATIEEANKFVAALKPAGESLNEMFTTVDSLFFRDAALDQSETGNEGHPFDIREYEQTAKEVKLAADRLNELLSTTEHLLGSPELKHGIQEVNDSVDGRIMTATDQSQVVMNAFFWRICALLGLLFAMLILYRVISLLLMRRRDS